MPKGPLGGPRPSTACNLTATYPTSVVPDKQQVKSIHHELHLNTMVDIQFTSSASRRGISFLPSKIERDYLDDFGVSDGIVVEFDTHMVPEDTLWGFEPGVQSYINDVLGEQNVKEPFITGTVRGVSGAKRPATSYDVSILHTIPVDYSVIENELEELIHIGDVRGTTEREHKAALQYVKEGSFSIEDSFIVNTGLEVIEKEDIQSNIVESLKRIKRSDMLSNSLERPLHTDQVVFYRVK